MQCALGAAHGSLVPRSNGISAGVHLCSEFSDHGVAIYFHSNPMFEEIVTFEGPMVTDEFITVSDKPGVGVEINEEGMRKYATPGVPFFE